MPIQEAVLSNGVRTVTVLVTWDQIAEVHHGTARAQQISISLGNVEDFTVYSFDNLTRAVRELGVPLFAAAFATASATAGTRSAKGLYC